MSEFRCGKLPGESIVNAVTQGNVGLSSGVPRFMYARIYFIPACSELGVLSPSLASFLTWKLLGVSQERLFDPFSESHLKFVLSTSCGLLPSFPDTVEITMGCRLILYRQCAQRSQDPDSGRCGRFIFFPVASSDNYFSNQCMYRYRKSPCFSRTTLIVVRGWLFIS
ncbi:hypothetical protein BDN67DRAFT_818785 [Paxillus ammoniavirescens]|nr:hypothetical protein BDN67DRAFT_818785 [Paxillus ammoniavirescens]